MIYIHRCPSGVHAPDASTIQKISFHKNSTPSTARYSSQRENKLRRVLCGHPFTCRLITFFVFCCVHSKVGQQQPQQQQQEKLRLTEHPFHKQNLRLGFWQLFEKKESDSNVPGVRAFFFPRPSPTVFAPLCKYPPSNEHAHWHLIHVTFRNPV